MLVEQCLSAPFVVIAATPTLEGFNNRKNFQALKILRSGNKRYAEWLRTSMDYYSVTRYETRDKLIV